MEEKLELMFKKLKSQHPKRSFFRLVVRSDFSGEVVHGLDGDYGDYNNPLIEFDDGEFFAWLDEFTDPNAEKRQWLHRIQDRIEELRARESQLWNELRRADDLPF